MFYVYILYSRAKDKYYIGYSSDFVKRLKEHNDLTFGLNTFTRKNGPWELKAAFELQEESEAIQIERFIKSQKSRKLIEKIISGEPLRGILEKLEKVSL